MAVENTIYQKLTDSTLSGDANLLNDLADQADDYPFDQLDKIAQFIGNFATAATPAQQAAIEKIKARLQVQQKTLADAEQNIAQIETLDSVTSVGAVFLKRDIQLLQSAGAKIDDELQDKINQGLQEFDAANNLSAFQQISAAQMDDNEDAWRQMAEPIINGLRGQSHYSDEELEVIAQLAIQNLKINTPQQNTHGAQAQFIQTYKSFIEQYDYQMQIEQANKLALQEFAKKHKMTPEAAAELKIGVEKGLFDDENNKEKYADFVALREKYLSRDLPQKIDDDVREAVMTSYAIQTETFAYRTAQITGAKNITPATKSFIQDFAAKHPKMYEYGKIAAIAGSKSLLVQAIGMVGGVNGLAAYSAYNTYQSLRKAYNEFKQQSDKQGFVEFLKYLKQPENAQKRIDLIRQVAQTSISVGFAVAANVSGLAYMPGTKWLASTATNLATGTAKVVHAAKDYWKNRDNPEQKAKNKKILKGALIGLGIAAVAAATFGLVKGEEILSKDDDNSPTPPDTGHDKGPSSDEAQTTPVETAVPQAEVVFTDVKDNENLAFAVNATPTPTYHKLMEMGVLSEEKAHELMGGRSYIPSRVLKNYLENEAKFTPEQKAEFENFFNDHEARKAEFLADKAAHEHSHNNGGQSTTIQNAENNEAEQNAEEKDTASEQSKVKEGEANAQAKQPQSLTFTVEEKKKYLLGLVSKLKNGQETTISDSGNPQVNAALAANKYCEEHGSSRVVVTDANGHKAEIYSKTKETEYGSKTHSTFKDLESGEKKNVTTYTDKNGNLMAAAAKFKNSSLDAHTVGDENGSAPDIKERSVVVGDNKYTLVKDGDNGKQYIVHNSVSRDGSGNIITNEKGEPQIERNVTEVKNGNKIMKQLMKQATSNQK